MIVYDYNFLFKYTGVNRIKNIIHSLEKRLFSYLNVFITDGFIKWDDILRNSTLSWCSHKCTWGIIFTLIWSIHLMVNSKTNTLFVISASTIWVSSTVTNSIEIWTDFYLEVMGKSPSKTCDECFHYNNIDINLLIIFKKNVWHCFLSDTTSVTIVKPSYCEY